MSNQYSIFDDCFVDSFAGGGGASTGIEMATGHPVDVAINHNEAAIMMHQRNHPFTEHYIEDIWQVDPKTAVRGRHVRLAWFSPTGVDGANLNDPAPTVTAVDHNSMVLSHTAHFKGKDKGQHPLDPLMTVTARDGQFADIRATVVKWDGQTDLGYWNEIRKMLNSYCGYTLADDEILLLNIRGAWYFISDIGLRMLTPRELYDAMGFPHDYIIDRDVNGNAITRADQVARCGNAVCPAVAEALVRANLPEYCKKKISDMAQLHDFMSS